MLQTMGSQRVRHNLVTEQQQITNRKPNLSCGSQFANSCLREENHDNTASQKEFQNKWWKLNYVVEKFRKYKE